MHLQGRATDQLPMFNKFFPQCENTYGVVQYSDKDTSSELVLCTGDELHFHCKFSAPQLFVFGVLNDRASKKDGLLFPDGTSSMGIFVVHLEDEGGFNEYVDRCKSGHQPGIAFQLS